MEFRFEISGAESDEDLSSLYAWLDGDRALQRRVDVRLVERSEPDSMGGGVLDAVVAIVATGASVGQLAVAILAWRHATRPRSTRRVVFSSDDEEVDPTDLRELLEAFERSEESEDPDDEGDDREDPDDGAGR